MSNSSSSRRAIAPWLVKIMNWVSSGFLSILTLSACLVPVLWAMGLDVAGLKAAPLNISQVCELCIYLSVALGVSTFLSSYILLGHPTAYVGPLFMFSSTVLLSHQAIFVLTLVPIVLGTMAGHYLNRYTRFKIVQAEVSTVMEFVGLRFVFACGAMLLSMALIDGPFRLFAGLIWILMLAMYLTPAFLGIWQRAKTQIAG